jgi:hypothetical protein
VLPLSKLQLIQHLLLVLVMVLGHQHMPLVVREVVVEKLACLFGWLLSMVIETQAKL